jgi:hypothetical protein
MREEGLTEEGGGRDRLGARVAKEVGGAISLPRVSFIYVHCLSKIVFFFSSLIL